eukprot:177625-Amphidinium_carterae.1
MCWVGSALSRQLFARSGFRIVFKVCFAVLAVAASFITLLEGAGSCVNHSTKSLQTGKKDCCNTSKTPSVDYET